MAPTTTAAPLPTGAPTAGGDEFDDLFDYDIGGENDPFSDNYKLPGGKDITNDNGGPGSAGANLGIDEEIEVTRKPRAPRVKLDEHRLMSVNGIPKLRKKAKTDLKLKGKGHEYSDAARLLAFYQLWLDDLFPKARFLDALTMVEKMGHKKMLQTARMDWINEGKPKSADLDDTMYDDPIPPARQAAAQEGSATRVAPIFERGASQRPKTPEMNGNIDLGDLYDATPEGARKSDHVVLDNQDSLFAAGAQSIFGPRTTIIAGEEPDEDDLDALLAEQDALQTTTANKQDKPTTLKSAAAEDNFDDEMEAMAEMEGMW